MSVVLAMIMDRYPRCVGAQYVPCEVSQRSINEKRAGVINNQSFWSPVLLPDCWVSSLDLCWHQLWIIPDVVAMKV